jgi:hypothetical protein
MTHELFDGFSIAHQGTQFPLLAETADMADAVGAVQRTALDVVQAQPALAVLDDLTGPLGQPVNLLSAEQRDDDGTHVVPPHQRNGPCSRSNGRLRPTEVIG